MKNINLIVLVMLTAFISSCKKDNIMDYSELYIVTLNPQKGNGIGVVKLRAEILSTGRFNVTEYGFKVTDNGKELIIPVNATGTNFNKQYSTEITLSSSTNYSVRAYAYTKAPNDSIYYREGNYQQFTPGNIAVATANLNFSIVSASPLSGGVYTFVGSISNPNSDKIIEYGFTCIDHTNSNNNKTYIIFQNSSSPNTTPTLSLNFTNTGNPLTMGDMYSIQAYAIIDVNGNAITSTSSPTVVNP